MRRKDTKARVLLVDDHPIVRERLGQLINQEDDLAVCGDCGTARECLELLKTIRADLAIVDLSLKNSSGLDLIKDIRFQEPDLPVLVLSMHDESLYAERALRAGARGYVTKAEATQTILTAMRAVLGGEIYVGERLARQLVGVWVGGRKNGETPPVMDQFTDREFEVFQLIGQQQTTLAIAETLKIDVKTVETYQARLKRKLELASMEELREFASKATQGVALNKRIS